VLGRVIGTVRAVDGVSLKVEAGKTLALVGESGCGKSTVGRAILRLIEPDSGSVSFHGEEILALDKPSLRQLRRRMQIIFQDPYASLNPRRTVHDIIGAPMLHHGVVDRSQQDAAVANQC
jgi:ABC-type glutathione transport system ATPase component